MAYLLILIPVATVAASHLLLKKGLLIIGQFPQSFSELIPFFLKTFTNIYVISAVVLTIPTALVWILAISRTQLSFAYPFLALSYVLVALFSLLIFKEDVTILRWLGILVICAGVFLVSRS
jgi:drug/metabolite transporter (DMT)-like permease